MTLSRYGDVILNTGTTANCLLLTANFLQRPVYFPMMTKRIGNAPEPVAVVLISHRMYFRCACINSLCGNRVRIINQQPKSYAYTAEPTWTVISIFRRFIGNIESRPAYR